MTSSNGNAQSYTAKKEKIIAEFFTKVLQIILESRCSYMSSPSSSSCSSSFNTRDKWFNLAVKEYPQALENIDFLGQSNFKSMVIDIVLCESLNFSSKRNSVKNQPSKGQFCNFVSFEKEEFGVELRNGKVIERWVVQYESQMSGDSDLRSKKCTANLHALYKKFIVLLRSLYVTVRLLPAYKLFKDLISPRQIRRHRLLHRVSSFVEPFTRKEEADMQQFSFTPVDTSWGRLCLSVSYRSSLCDVSSEPSNPISPWFIPDYVGSPLNDPLKRFPSLPVSHGPSSCSLFSRCHSSSHENYQASSSSSMYSSDCHASKTKCRSCLPPPMTFQATRKSIDFDEYWPSPLFSPAPFSSPMYVARIDASKALLRHESTPVSISASKVSNKHTLRAPSLPKAERAASLKSEKFIDASALLDKISFSRSSRRFQIQDDFDDTVFSCPFVADEDNMMDTASRPVCYNHGEQPNEQLEPGGSLPVRKSEDAAVGALILMLKKAPPLVSCDQDACSNKGKLVLKPEDQRSEKGPSSDVMSSKTIADALEELQAFVGIKEMLLTRTQGSRLNMVKMYYVNDTA